MRVRASVRSNTKRERKDERNEKERSFIYFCMSARQRSAPSQKLLYSTVP